MLYTSKFTQLLYPNYMYLFMIACYVFMAVSAINLTLTGISGYWDYKILGASHTRFALFTVLIFTITETLVMYFFITTGKAIKKAVEDGLGNDALWEREKKIKNGFVSTANADNTISWWLVYTHWCNRK